MFLYVAQRFARGALLTSKQDGKDVKKNFAAAKVQQFSDICK